jgi:glutathione-specific gamma-glutamylcyclotransferase
MSDDGFWVFGYGSLMWKPGFAFAEAAPARLMGFHRALCIFSLHYRGTPQHPGLVFGLAPGGACDGIAFRVEGEHGPAVRRYLIDRELITGVYRARQLTVDIADGTGRAISAYCFVAERQHPQAAHSLSLPQQAALVAGSRGSSGRNIDYVLSTLAQLRALGIRDRSLERLVSLMHGYAALRRLNAAAPCGLRTKPPRAYPAGIAPPLPAHRQLMAAHRRRM